MLYHYIVVKDQVRNFGDLRGDAELREKIGFLYGTIIMYPGKPTNSQIKRLNELRQKRNQKEVDEALASLKDAAINNRNLMSEFISCAKVYATLGEMINVLKEPFGEYIEPAEF